MPSTHAECSATACGGGWTLSHSITWTRRSTSSATVPDIAVAALEFAVALRQRRAGQPPGAVALDRLGPCERPGRRRRRREAQRLARRGAPDGGDHGAVRIDEAGLERLAVRQRVL